MAHEFLERMREKYKDVLAQIEKDGLNKEQREYDKVLCKLFKLDPLDPKGMIPQLKDLDKQIQLFIETKTK